MRLSILSVSSILGVALAALVCSTPSKAVAADLFGLSPGPVELKSAGHLAFGPSGVLFVGDAKAAKVYALNTEDKKQGSVGDFAIDDLAAAAGKALGGEVEFIDLAVNPETQNAFMSVTVGGEPAIAKVTRDGTITRLNLDKIGHGAVSLPDAPEDKVVKTRRGNRNARDSAITDLAFTEGRVLVSGMSTNESPSSVREFDFPFREGSRGMQVEIYHAAHGRSEDGSPIQTFIPFNIGGEPSVLAGYQCTPLVKIPIGKLKSTQKVKGTTVAELGNRNRPLDMIAYNKGGKDFLLIANDRRGVMKVSTENLESNEGLTEKVNGGGTAGQPYETIESLAGTIQLAQLDDAHALVVVQRENGPLSMRAVAMP